MRKIGLPAVGAVCLGLTMTGCNGIMPTKKAPQAATNWPEACTVFRGVANTESLPPKLVEEFKKGVEIIQSQTGVDLFRGDVQGSVLKVLTGAGNLDDGFKKVDKESEALFFAYENLYRTIDELLSKINPEEIEILRKKLDAGELKGAEQTIAESQISTYDVYQEMRADIAETISDRKDEITINDCDDKLGMTTIGFAGTKGLIVGESADVLAHEIMHKILGRYHDHHTDPPSKVASSIEQNGCGDPKDLYKSLCGDHLMCSVNLGGTKLSPEEIAYTIEMNKKCAAY